jgi:hypothetical protein
MVSMLFLVTFMSFSESSHVSSGKPMSEETTTDLLLGGVVNRPPIGAALAGRHRICLSRNRAVGVEAWWWDRERRWRFPAVAEPSTTPAAGNWSRSRSAPALLALVDS